VPSTFVRTAITKFVPRILQQIHSCNQNVPQPIQIFTTFSLTNPIYHSAKNPYNFSQFI